MRRSLLVAVAAAALLASCAKKAEVQTGQSTPAASAEVATAGPVSGPAKMPEASGAPALAAPMLAYRYSYALEAPAGAVRDLMKLHEKACADAGPSVCQLVSQDVRGEGRDSVGGSIKLRATAAWIAQFRASVGGQMKTAGGKVLNDAVSSEDLTHQIVDVDAAIRAKTALRDRLQSLIASRPAKLADLLEVENELARVQGEIDAAQSEVAVMKARIAMSELAIDYRSNGAWAPEGTWAPVGQAAKDSLSLFAFALALLVRTVAVTAPFAIPTIVGVWLWRRGRGRKPVRPAAA